MIWRRACALGLAVSMSTVFGGAGVAPAQTVLTADEMRVAAHRSLKSGNPAQADVLTSALLKRDENDLTALLIRARALRDLGQMREARQMARRAWALSDNDADKYATALITAQVLSSDGKRTRAQLWLRRAVEHAPNAQLEAKAKRDFAYVKHRNPWSTRLSFTLAPNSNINNGSARDQSELNYQLSEVLFGQSIQYDLQGSAQALAGFEIGGAVRSRYRFKESRRTAHDLNFSASYRTFVLSSSAQAQAPDVSGSDFSYGTLSLGYGLKQRNMDRKGTFAFDVEAGQTWYGGARYASFLRSTAQQSLRTSATRQYRFGVSAERQWGQATADRDEFGISGSLTERLAGGQLGFVKLNLTTTHSPNQDSEYGEVSLRTGMVLAKPIMGAAVQFSLGAAFRDYDVSRHSRDGRQDRRIFADVTATFQDIEYYGFNPSVTLNASHTDSNIGLYDTRRFGLSVGIRSAF